MARFNIEDELYNDPRFRRLVRHLNGDDEKALGKYAQFMMLAQKHWGSEMSLVPEGMFAQGDWQILIDVGFAERQPDGIKAHDSETLFEWYLDLCRKSKKGVSARRAKLALRLTPGSTQGLTSGSTPGLTVGSTRGSADQNLSMTTSGLTRGSTSGLTRGSPPGNPRVNPRVNPPTPSPVPALSQSNSPLDPPRPVDNFSGGSAELAYEPTEDGAISDSESTTRPRRNRDVDRRQRDEAVFAVEAICALALRAPKDVAEIHERVPAAAVAVVERRIGPGGWPTYLAVLAAQINSRTGASGELAQLRNAIQAELRKSAAEVTQ